MNKKIDKLFESPLALLVFAIVSGLGYFSFVLSVIMSFSKGGSPLLGFFFAPAIICGIALCIVKIAKNNIMAEEYDKNRKLFYIHLLVILIGIVFFIDMLVH